MEKVIAIIDLKSFYASCECACRHLDIFSTPLVCCDPYRSGSSVVMSATPYLKKKYGIPNVCRKRDLPKVKGMIYAVPRMSYYLRMSAKVNSIYLNYVAEEDLHVYSVDESFLNIGPYLKMYNCSPEELVTRIKRDIWEQLGLVATAGIGPNMFLAKNALDHEGKKREPYVAHWDYEDVETKLWKIHPMTEIWGIGNGLSSHLQRIGIKTLRDLAHAPDSLLKKEFGVIGLQLKSLANGRDDSNIEEKYTPKERSLTQGQTLMREYYPREALQIIREEVDEVCFRLRKLHMMTKKIALYCGCSDGTSFGRQFTLPSPTDDNDIIFGYFKGVMDSVSQELPIRGISVCLGKLRSEDYEQYTLFEDPDTRDINRVINETLDNIKSVFGLNSVLRASSLLESSTIRERHGQIGGHRQ